MFFLLPKVTLVLLLVFGLLVAFRSWRQRHGRPRPPRRRRRRSRPAAGGHAEPLLPASLLKGADRTWVVFVTGDGSAALVDRLRAAQPDAEITEVDSARGGRSWRQPFSFGAFRRSSWRIAMAR